jgi:dCTP diphosphatase
MDLPEIWRCRHAIFQPIYVTHLRITTVTDEAPSPLTKFDSYCLRYHSSMTKSGTPADLEELKQCIRAFAFERGWERFHTPKNLAMALIGEAGELVERFQWLSPEESLALSPERHEQVRQEIADVLIYLTRLADMLDIDLMQAAADKIALNGRKYPVDKAKGNAAKYNEL